jgi:signal transduction histidine kinase/ActR/RegA family two-component response regulator
MVRSLREIRADTYTEIGGILERDLGLLIERWSQRAALEQPGAARLHGEALRDHLPVFLQELARCLVQEGEAPRARQNRLANLHGKERWEAGWSLEEVVRDYQILRLVILEYLEEAVERPLRGEEVMAIGLFLDDAIAASVSAYSRFLEGAAREQERQEAEREAVREAAHTGEQMELLKETSRRKDEFLAVLGHELRNPLAPLGNALQILHMRGADPPTVAWAQEIVKRQVSHLTRLVDDLLDISRIGRGKILLRQEHLQLDQLVATIFEDYRQAGERAGITVKLEVSPTPLWVVGDRVRLTQVTSNLLDNAIKFTDPGGSVSVQLLRSEDNRAAILTVRDTGIGIEPELLTRVFELYSQGDQSMQRSRSGLGLGLALVKGLVELHHGSVRAASAGTGCGAEFRVSLPLAPDSASSEDETGPSRPVVEPLRILVIEDNRDAAETLRVLLELHNHQVVVAHSGPAGLESARQFRPQTVLCDLGLPGMDGLAVARALRASPGIGSPFLVALTGYGSEDDQKRCHEAGFDAHLVKPVEVEELQKLLIDGLSGIREQAGEH